MNTQIAKEFTEEWIKAWNSHLIDEIMSHYAEEIAFHSPFITLLKFNDTGVIRSKEELKKYFEIGLKAYPELHFELHHYFVGIDTLVIYYNSVNGRIAAEVFELNEEGKAVKIYCHYADQNTASTNS